MSIRKLIVGNWKMLTSPDGTSLAEAKSLVKALREGLADFTNADVGVCPPYVHLSAVAELISGFNIKLGAQNVYFQEKGAFTGEISPLMLKDIGCEYVIIGHSERRTIFKEDDDTINKKVKTALKAGLTPIMCVGETLQQRQEEITEKIIRFQVERGLDDLSPEDVKRVVIAYEPVWAIGTGKNATPEQAQAVHLFIRKLLVLIANDQVAQTKQIIYGGSVKAENAKILMTQPDIDGALVGGASLNVESFIKIVKSPF
ncbi:MAG: triose-phosphate isomerase [Planctomycetota bacterium]